MFRSGLLSALKGKCILRYTREPLYSRSSGRRTQWTRSGQTQWSPATQMNTLKSHLCTSHTGYKDCLKQFIHLFNLPVDVPLLHAGEPPGGHRQTSRHVDADQPVGGNSQELIFLAPSESVARKRRNEMILILFHG